MDLDEIGDDDDQVVLSPDYHPVRFPIELGLFAAAASFLKDGRRVACFSPDLQLMIDNLVEHEIRKLEVVQYWLGGLFRDES
ncbi:MAG: hypothetical protein FJ267_14590 [Planctomycetes bacterium]|nr:hypothetical protein [Planctomycetota bacterium]